jgi:hypothetical protein
MDRVLLTLRVLRMRACCACLVELRAARFPAESSLSHACKYLPSLPNLNAQNLVCSVHYMIDAAN